MTDDTRNSPKDEVGPNPGYATLQLAKALTTAKTHPDPETRERAHKKVSRWQQVLENMLSGLARYGSRKPFAEIPVWATPEVILGGFATGRLVAGGSLQEHETAALAKLSLEAPKGEERSALNHSAITEEGLATLGERLRTGHYDVEVPEEGALLSIAWLALNGHEERARGILAEIAPYFRRLRFYPIPLEQPRPSGSQVHVQDVATALEGLRKIPPRRKILVQKEAATVWAPLHDRIVALFLETVQDGWPCQKYPSDWEKRALAALEDYEITRRQNPLCGKPHRAKGHQAQLRAFLRRCALKPASLNGREVGRIRKILNDYVAKRDTPGSPRCLAARDLQRVAVSAPTYHAIAGVVIPRLEGLPPKEGLDDPTVLLGAVDEEEAAHTGIPVGTEIPTAIARKVERTLRDTVDALIEKGLIPSGEVLAKVLPQITAGLRAAGFADPDLRRLYAAIYRAFRRRRSLLLLNLEKQVGIEELPWVAALEAFRSESLSTQQLARRTLEEVTLLTLRFFPYAILPNKLLQEMRALVQSAGLDLPLVDELAADIFMGQFTWKFADAAQRAGDLLEGTLYATYYGIDYGEVRRIPKPRNPRALPGGFAQLCASRAGVGLGGWDVVKNGMILEQQQILTTQNLAVLYSGLGLRDALRDHLPEITRQCFGWIVARLQVRVHGGHAALIRRKQTAYAWRQMLFVLSLLPEDELNAFLTWAEEHLAAQREDFRHRFRPLFEGLLRAAAGSSPEEAPKSRRFLGWVQGQDGLRF